MKKANTNEVYVIGRATDFGSGLSATSTGSWLRVHEVGSTSSGPRGRVHELDPANNFGTEPSDTEEDLYATRTTKLLRELKHMYAY